jgi:hypothetical protein
MRTLVLILILLNLAFLYWHIQYDGPAERSAPIVTDGPGPAGVARLVLLSERGNGSAQRAAAGTAAAYCETVGPLADRGEAEALRTRLEQQGVLASLRTASREVVSAYWVFLPPEEDMESALAVARDLSRQGLDDLYVIREGDYRHGLSLGLFSEHGRARRRLAEVEGLGYAPQIEARFRIQTVFWLDLVVPPGRGTDLEVPAGLGRTGRACPNGAVPG